MGQEGTVLIVDDEPAGRETLEALLAKENYRLLFAAHGLEAIAQATQAQPDVVLLDVMMPDLDGFEVCRRLRDDPRLAEIPVILITALDDQESRLRGIEAGADDFVTKPCNRVELRARVRNIVRLNRYRRLLDARGKFEQLFNLSPDGIVVADAAGRILMANPAMAPLAGAPNAEGLVGRGLLEWVATEQAALCQDHLQRVLTGASPTARFDAAWVRDNGTHLPVEITLGALAWDGQPRAQVLVRDITDRSDKALLEAKLIRAQRLESIGTLASGIAHDLNNVLTPTLMAVETLTARTDDPKNKELLATLGRNVMRGASIVRQVLAFGRGLEGEQDLLQLRYVLREILQIATETFPKSIEIREEIARDLWLVRGDATQLHQAVLNLCVNARDAMTGGGTLTIDARNEWLDSTFGSMLPEAVPGPYVRLEVADTGTGIAPAIRDKIFDPFFTTKEVGKGTGLGLSSVVGIVRKHRGCLSVASEVGKGSQFRLYLPAVHGECDPASVPAPEPPPQGNGELVLVADDEPAIREIMQLTLTQNGYRELTAKDGAEAVALFAQHRGEIRAAVLDFMMPVLDGVATLHVLRHLQPQLPVVLMPGSVEDADSLRRAQVTPRVKTVSKPFTASDLLRTLTAALRNVE